MNRTICAAAFVVGLIAVVWVGAGYVGSSPLALAMTMLIGVVYVAGAVELLRFHQATAALARALGSLPESPSHPAEWLGRLPPSLQAPVRMRIEGERAGLPGPAMTPYLAGLLVLLGMLGTFLGMVVTLKGVVLALEGTTDLAAIRASLAAPVKGLGVAFGTSVAGVAASAMLGLVSALCRRERLQVAQLLDARIATTLRGFSLAHQRQETFKALQLQSRALPDLADKLQAMMAQMERHNRESNERLAGEQERFYRDARTTFSDLADSVGKSLEASVAESARLAGETMRPVVAATMSGLAREATALQEHVTEAVRMQLDGISERFGASVATVAETWSAALASHERTSERVSRQLQEALASHGDTFERRSAALLAMMGETAAALLAELVAGEQARQAALAGTVESMATSLRQDWQQAGERAMAQQVQLCRTLNDTANDIAASAQTQAARTIDEVARLMETAAAAPRAAAEVIIQLRQELSASIARDNELLAERSRIMESLNALVTATHQATTEQRAAIDALVASSAAVLEHAGTRFAESVTTHSARVSDAADQVSGGAVEVASLADAFGLAVRLFSESNDKLMAALERIEGALDKSMARSDDQLAYYVAQAREIIDLSLMSQSRIVEDLQRISGRQASLTGQV